MRVGLKFCTFDKLQGDMDSAGSDKEEGLLLKGRKKDWQLEKVQGRGKVLLLLRWKRLQHTDTLSGRNSQREES